MLQKMWQILIKHWTILWQGAIWFDCSQRLCMTSWQRSPHLLTMSITLDPTCQGQRLISSTWPCINQLCIIWALYSALPSNLCGERCASSAIICTLFTQLCNNICLVQRSILWRLVCPVMISLCMLSLHFMVKREYRARQNDENYLTQGNYRCVIACVLVLLAGVLERPLCNFPVV